MGTIVKALVAIVLGMLTQEVPGLPEHKSWPRWQDSAQTLGTAVTTEAAAELLVARDIDAALLGAIAYRESRFRARMWDGDCFHPKYGFRLDTDAGPAKVPGAKCSVVGPMQVSKSWVTWARERSIPGLDALTVGELRKPRPNVRVAYHVLAQWKRLCGGSPAVWLTAYRRSRCPRRLSTGRRYVDSEAKIRCRIAEKFHAAMHADDDAAWSCLGKQE